MSERENLIRKISLAVVSLGVLAIGVGGSGNWYIGTWPLNPNLSYKEKGEIMERKNLQLEAERVRFSESDSVSLLNYEFE